MEPIYLRALEMEDSERTNQWHNDPELYESLLSPYRYVSRAMEEEWVRKVSAYSWKDIYLAICLKEDALHIGNIYLMEIDWVARHAKLGMLIGNPQYRSKGYGTAALRLAIRHAFQDLGLRRVHLSVLEENRQAIRAYEKSGFIVEGRLRQHVFKQGEYKDLLVMGVCVGDPQSTKAKLPYINESQIQMDEKTQPWRC